MTITADSTTTLATVQDSGNGIFQGTIPWTNTAGNPSEHTVYAQANIHITHYGQTQYKSLDSRTTDTGAGRAADFIVSNLQLQSLQYKATTGTPLTLMQDNVTPVPVPQVTWTQANPPVATNNPAGYVMGSVPTFAYTLYNITGGATTGLTMTATATPSPGSDPSFTLKDTAGSPIPFTGSTVTVNAATPLLSKVYRYQMMLGNLALWVQFTKTGQTPGPWRLVTSYGSPTTLSTFFYGILAKPTAPMAKPWVPVLDYACQWATGTADATSATTELANSEWNNCTYDENTVYTDLSTDPNTNGYPQDGHEVFSLQQFLNNTLHRRNQLTGDCRVFADFLCCLSNAIGATPLQVQRSASVKDILHNSDGHCFFTTKYGFQAPPVQGVYAQTVSWQYHQWTTSNIYDGAFRVSTSNSPTVYPTSVISLTNKSITDYHNTLVDTTISPSFWQPQTAFTPSVVN